MQSSWAVIGILATLLSPLIHAAALSPSLLNRASLIERHDAATGFRNPVLAARAHSFLNSKTRPYSVNGTGLPDVHFDIGESYAGLLPVSQAGNETRELFFWFFPTTDPAQPEEVTIWLTGGPGCSSLLGMLQENGPFLWQPGTQAPVKNPYTWVNLTNMLYIEQPVGVGFTKGKPDPSNEYAHASDLAGFYKNFVNLFDVQGWKVYITGESYAGIYVPYAANAFLEAKDAKYYNLQGITINDPAIGDETIQEQVILQPFVESWQNVLNLNKTTRQHLAQMHKDCGYADYLNKYMRFPPPKVSFPTLKDPFVVSYPQCDVFRTAYSAIQELHPCFDLNRVTLECPTLSNVIDTSGSASSATDSYFSRHDVQKVIHAPIGNWSACAADGTFNDESRNVNDGPARNGILQRIVEHTNNVIIGSGNQDMNLPTNGTLLSLQNMTWNGLQGFQQFPGKEFFVPYHTDYNPGALAGAGNVGWWGSERGLTFYQVQISGHMVPGDAPLAAYRSIQLMLGRIKGLSQGQ